MDDDKRKPNINRNSRLRKMLRNSLLNINIEMVDTKDKEVKPTPFNFIDLFSGAGGISCGLEMAGLNSIFAAEIDPIAAETYRNNFKNSHIFCGDIKNLTTDEMNQYTKGKPIHVVAGGFPCQGFSLAGFRDPNDKRNVLYKEVVRFVQAIRPQYVVLENVANIITMQKGKVYRRILSDFDSIGYPNMSVLILEAAEYGIAQLRPRAIFIANRFGLKNPYPKPQLKPNNFVPIEAAIEDLKNKPCDPSINHEWTKHSKEFEERISNVKSGASLYKSYLDAYKRQYKGYPCMTIKENHGGTHIHYDLNRTISAREMARLQSFPDSFFFSGTMKKAMWQIGNAVAPLMFKNIGLALVPKLDEISRLGFDASQQAV